MSEITPMMSQYLKIKEQYRHCLLFFRLGDFYELFFEDAVIASKELEITLTKKSYGNGQKADMCGVPYHSASGYIAKLIEKNYKVAICEQVEEAKDAKGLVKREVIRVITPGTVTDALSLDETSNNYICAIYNDKSGYGIAFADVSTGEFKVTSSGIINSTTFIIDELEKYKPSEIICTKSLEKDKIYNIINDGSPSIKLYPYEDWAFNEEMSVKKLCAHLGVLTIDGYGFNNKLFICAAGGLLNYLYETQKNNLSQIRDINVYQPSEYMMIDHKTRRNLEITEPINKLNKRNCLYWTLNNTKTSMGARLLRRYIEQPLTNIGEINQRLAAVSEFKQNVLLRGGVRKILSEIYDIERLITRFIYRSANARDMIALKSSILSVPELKRLLSNTEASYFQVIAEEIDTLSDIFELIKNTIVDEPPFSVNEGGLIKSGYSAEIDELNAAKTDGSKWLDALLEREIEQTGIKNLKIKNNRIFGYFIEVTKSNIHLAPDRYIRRQTLGNCERYTTNELRELESKIVGAEQKLFQLEYEIFCETREFIISNSGRIQRTAQILALLDVVQSLAETADRNGYNKPEITEESVIEIRGGRHPVVESALPEAFVSNDTFLDDDENRLVIITGPNMAGKSTYMRQTAIIVLMAQIGSFVPANYCRLKPVDKIFTRVGASDDLASGQSTFMVEMAEVANILHNATSDSLIILDEIGRGTSTFDGLSIAWAVIEYISDKRYIGAKTLFATHYHELTELEGRLPGIKNFCILVKEQGDSVIFLRKIQRGGAERSLGAAVAKLAGVPMKVVKRSEQILKQLNDADITKKSKTIAKDSKIEAENTVTQPDIFSVKNDMLIEKINSYEITKMTPIEAMQALYDLQKGVKGL